MTEKKKSTVKKTASKVKKETKIQVKKVKKTVVTKVKKIPIVSTGSKIIEKKQSNNIKKGDFGMNNMFSGEYFYACGKRKTSIARVRFYESGKGEIIVNGKKYNEYFKTQSLFELIKSGISLLKVSNYSITAKILGGGASAQADALRHGIAKALSVISSDNRSLLKKAGQLSRDDRKVERKKYGRRKARRAQQWVKR